VGIGYNLEIPDSQAFQRIPWLFQNIINHRL